MALERKTKWARFRIGISLVLVATWVVVLLVDGYTSPVAWISTVAWLLIAATAAFSLRAARRETRAFEQEHGADAGVQQPVT